MKRFKFILILLIICGCCGTLKSWDTTAAKYYPLAVGNLWSYRITVFGPMSCILIQSQTDFIVRVERDSIMPNGKKYFYVTGWYNSGYQRIDSSTMKVYSWINGNECLLDSLFSRIGDSYLTCRSVTSHPALFYDSIRINFAGQMRKVRSINAEPLLGENYTLMENIGVYSHYQCEYGGSMYKLNGCIINGIQYGNIIGIKNNETQLKYFSLTQNYPNPFNPKTMIKFSLPFPSKGGVSLVIYDVVGRKVASLIPPLWGGQEGLQPGTYEIEFDGTNYPSGVYLYKLTAGDFTEAKRMVLLK